MMDQLKSLGRRDIFGILLPGVIVVFAGVYALIGVLGGLLWPDDDSLGLELLLSVALFVVSYLAGSVLRLHSVSDVDKEAGDRLRKRWMKKCRKTGLTDSIIGGLEREFEELKAELVQGKRVEASVVRSKFAPEFLEKVEEMSERPNGLEFDDWFLEVFDEWVWRTDEFPYSAWLNRKWQSGNLCALFDFFSNNSGTCMWPRGSDWSDRWRRRDFFGYCKMAVIGYGGQMADEVRAAEGLIRFFAGTAVALRLTTYLLGISWLVVALIHIWELGIASFFPIPPTFQGFYLIFTPILIFVVGWARFWIVQHFRGIRNKEVDMVYCAFHLYSSHHPELAADRAKQSQGNSQERWQDRLLKCLAVLFE